jgi:hypothetical protein
MLNGLRVQIPPRAPFLKFPSTGRDLKPTRALPHGRRSEGGRPSEEASKKPEEKEIPPRAPFLKFPSTGRDLKPTRALPHGRRSEGGRPSEEASKKPEEKEIPPRAPFLKCTYC